MLNRYKKLLAVLLAVALVAVVLPAIAPADVPVSVPVDAAEAGEVANGGFEDTYTYTRGTDNATRTGATSWTISDWYTTIQSDTKKNGSYSARISANGDAAGHTVAEQAVPVNTNATYTFSFYGMADGKTSGCNTTYASCFTYALYGGASAGACNTAVVSTTTPTIDGSGWKTISCSVSTGSHKYLRIEFVGLGNNKGGDCYIDDVSLTVVNAGDTGTHARPSLTSFGVNENRPSSDSDNVIVQPGFESTTNAQWNTTNFLKQGVSVVTSGGTDGDAHSGSKFLKYYHGSVGYTDWPMFEITCPTAGDYVFSAWVRTPHLSANNVGAASIGIIDPDTNKFLTYGNAGGSYDGHYSNPETQLRSTATDDDWHLRSVSFYVGASNATVKIGMYGLKSTMYVDDISVHLLSKGVKYEGNQTGTLSASTSVTNKYCAAENSLIPDSSFNGDPSVEFWSKSSGWSNGFLEFNKDATSAAHGNTLHFKGTSPASNKTYRYIKFVDVEPNTAYTVSFDYRVVKTGNPLMFIDNNIVKNATFHTPNLGSASNNWKEYYFTFNSGNYNRIGIVFKDGSGEAYFDDFRFFKNSNGIADEPAEEVFPTLKHNKGEGNEVKKSRMEMDTSYEGQQAGTLGLAFLFNLEADGITMDNTTHIGDYSNAEVDAFEDGGSYKLVAAGAVMTNDSTVGQNESVFKRDNQGTIVNGKQTVIDVDAKYLFNVYHKNYHGIDTELFAYAIRIINIPKAHIGTTIYARPYYVFEYNGKNVTVYGDIVYDAYEEIPDINDGWLEWD